MKLTRSKKDLFIRDLLSRPFPQEWESWLSTNMALYRLLSDTERARLQDDARVLIAEKSWEGCDGLKVTELMKLTVAAQAALLLLGLEHDYFSRVLSVVLFPTEFELPPESWQERGSVIAGQAVDYGSVYLSWETVLTEARSPIDGHNLVVHEFAHQLDFLDGYTNGAPPLRDRDQSARWQQVMHGAFNRLRRELQKGRRTFLGSYAATNPAEFFSVASEKFFCVPDELRKVHPELFEVLQEYYCVDPIAWLEGKPGHEPSSAPTIPQPLATEDPPAPSHQLVTGSEFRDFNCPYCQNTISFPKSDAGALRQCPHCLESMLVPGPTELKAERIPFPIRTERLVLRRFQRLDAKDLADLLADPDNLRYVDWETMPLEETEEWIAGQSGIRFPQPGNYCDFAIEDVQAAKVIGLISVWLLNDAAHHDRFDLAQFEIIVHPRWQRKGYAAEAIRGLLTYVFKGLRIRRLIAECDARNVLAHLLLLKAGLRQESERIQDRLLKDEWVNTLGFALLRDEYESQRSPGRSV